VSSAEQPKAGHSPDCAVGAKSGAPNKAVAGPFKFILEVDATSPSASEAEHDLAEWIKSKNHGTSVNQTALTFSLLK
jgi:hypothetical protein